MKFKVTKLMTPSEVVYAIDMLAFDGDAHVTFRSQRTYESQFEAFRIKKAIENLPLVNLEGWEEIA